MSRSSICCSTMDCCDPSTAVNTGLSVTVASASPMFQNSDDTLTTVTIFGNTGTGSSGSGNYGGYEYGATTSSGGDGYYYGSYGSGYGSVYGDSGYYGASSYGSSYGGGSYSAVQFDPNYNPVVSFNLTLPVIIPAQVWRCSGVKVLFPPHTHLPHPPLATMPNKANIGGDPPSYGCPPSRYSVSLAIHHCCAPPPSCPPLSSTPAARRPSSRTTGCSSQQRRASTSAASSSRYATRPS